MRRPGSPVGDRLAIPEMPVLAMAAANGDRRLV
jgi:hypothetical protein